MPSYAVPVDTVGCMPNDRLRAAMLQRGITPDKLAEHVGVDPKTVERWIVKGREPYRRHRYTIAAFLGMEEVYLWPDALTRDEVAAASQSEIVTVYPHRSEVPRDVLGRFFAEAEREIGDVDVLIHVHAHQAQARRKREVEPLRDRLASPDRKQVVPSSQHAVALGLRQGQVRILLGLCWINRRKSDEKLQPGSDREP